MSGNDGHQNQEFVPYEHWMPELHQPIFQPDVQVGLFALPNDSHVGVPQDPPMATEPFVNPVGGHIPSMMHGHDFVAPSLASFGHMDLPQDPSMDLSVPLQQFDFEPGPFQQHNDGHDPGLAPLHIQSDQFVLPSQLTNGDHFALPIAQPDFQVGSSMPSSMHHDVFTHVGLPLQPTIGAEPYDHSMSDIMQNINDGHDPGLVTFHRDQFVLPSQQASDVHHFALPIAQSDLQIGSSMPSSMHHDELELGALQVHAHVGLPQHPAIGVAPHDHPMVQTDMNQEFVPYEHWMPELHQPIFQPDVQVGLFALPNDSHVGVPQDPPMADEPFVNPVGGHIPSMMHGHDFVAHSLPVDHHGDLPPSPAMFVEPSANSVDEHKNWSSWCAPKSSGKDTCGCPRK